ncbi:hypothetical protein PVK06_041925 [Gossypium arboreum]|uniref:Uncharacterized protein n=1 Tax=Gossypium arboreum TaxID=29729 RepID=A0ABR0NBS9_GOSAR|nr:hypothetical protein PVK06_041925 [Gossypium arboreum]
MVFSGRHAGRRQGEDPSKEGVTATGLRSICLHGIANVKQLKNTPEPPQRQEEDETCPSGKDHCEDDPEGMNRSYVGMPVYP